MSDFGDKAKSINFGHGKARVKTVIHEGEPTRAVRRIVNPDGSVAEVTKPDKTGSIAGVHVEHFDGRVDAVVGGHPDMDPGYLDYLVNESIKDHPTYETGPNATPEFHKEAAKQAKADADAKKAERAAAEDDGNA